MTNFWIKKHIVMMVKRVCGLYLPSGAGASDHRPSYQGKLESPALAREINHLGHRCKAAATAGHFAEVQIVIPYGMMLLLLLGQDNCDCGADKGHKAIEETRPHMVPWSAVTLAI
jgi:hypothetical protein